MGKETYLEKAEKILGKIIPLRTESLIFFTFQLATMTNVGIPLYRAIDAIEKQAENKTLKTAFSQIKADVLMGRSLSEALSRHPHIFSDFYLNTVKAGEASGTLSQSMLKLAEMMERNHAFSRKIKSIMTYPVLVFAFMLIISFVVFSYVFPKFGVVFKSMNIPLPLITRAFFFINTLFTNFFSFIFLAILGWIAVFIIKRQLTNPLFRYQVDLFKITLPIYGATYRKIVLVRICEIIATLIRAGVHLLPALELAGKSSNSEVYNDSLKTIRENVKEGKDLASAFREEGKIYPPFFIHMLTVAEEAGKIDIILPKAASLMQEEVEYTLGNIANLLGPVLIAATGFSVLIAVLAIYIPLNNFISRMI